MSEINQIRVAYPLATEFQLADTQGNPVRLSDFHGKKSVVLVLNRGFA